MATTQYRPTRTRGKPTDDGDFVVFEHVAVFDSHEGDDGVRYDQELLSRIAENCNRRIRDTGDWCPVVLAHTRDNDDKTSVNDDPPVIGLAGPFYVADFGTDQPRPCIYCHFWIFREFEKDFLRNPRRSVEIWPEETPENRYFDPIAVLGSETPKRDLGMIYSRRHGSGTPVRHWVPGPFRYAKRTTARKLKYQEGSAPVSTPGPSNTFIPGPVKKKQLNDKGEISMPFSQDELQQLVEVIKPIVQSEVAQAAAVVDSSEPDEILGDDLGGGLPPEIDGGELGPPADIGGEEMPPAGGEEDLGDLAAMGGEELPPAEGGEEMPLEEPPPESPELGEEDELYARGLGRKFCKYGKDDGEWDDDGADLYMNSLDDEDQGMLGSYMKYMCDSEHAKSKYAERYDKSPLPGDDITEKPGDCSPSGSCQEDEMSAGQATADRYKKERDSQALKYRKLAAEHEGLKKKLETQQGEISKIRQKERYSRRLQSLQEKVSEGFCLDAEEEMEFVEDFTDDQFDRHVSKVIPERYAKVQGEFIPIGGAEPGKSPPPKKSDGGKPEKYAKDARELVQRYRDDGRVVPYAKALRHLIDHDGQVEERELLAGTNGRT